MTISRKDFFRQGFFSLGETLLKVSGTMREAEEPFPVTADSGEPEREPVPDEEMVARADNRHCLAKGCGCYSCIERCEPEAIKLIPGVGIRINPQLCTGCGGCEYVCPVTPKAVTMIKRPTD